MWLNVEAAVKSLFSLTIKPITVCPSKTLKACMGESTTIAISKARWCTRGIENN
jgi:hypothetical protein